MNLKNFLKVTLMLLMPLTTVTKSFAADNFEIDIRGRYRRIDGYERFDGRELPSAVAYYKMPFITGTAKAKM